MYLDIINVIRNSICLLIIALSVDIRMEDKLKLVEYSDSESEADETVSLSTVPATQDGSVPVKDSQGRQVAIVEPTPQNVAVVQPMESIGGDDDDDEDLEGTGLFEQEVDDPLSTQATQGSSSQVDPYFVSPEIADSLQIENPRDNVDVIIISDSSQDTIIISEPCDLDDHRSATSGNYALLNIFLLLNLFNFLTKL